MKGLKRLGLAVAAVTAVLAIAGFVAGSVMAISGSISLSDGSAEPGGTGSVELTSNVGDPGLGAWTVDITYDTSVVSIPEDGCAPAAGGVCNPEFGDGVIRITGASATGLEGEQSLGTIEFECADAEATTDLTMVLDVFADATIGDPTDIDASVTDGSFDCAIEPTQEPSADTPTPGPVLPKTGTGLDSSSDTNWVIVALVGVALATLASLTALRFGSRRSQS